MIMMNYGTSFFRERDVFRFLNKIYFITCIVISTSVLTLLLRSAEIRHNCIATSGATKFILL